MKVPSPAGGEVFPFRDRSFRSFWIKAILPFPFYVARPPQCHRAGKRRRPRLRNDVQSTDGRVLKKRAAEYVRMSTDHQRYSTENQATVIRKYAVDRDYEIVRTYADAGKSGLSLGGRDALQRLLEDVRPGGPTTPRCWSTTSAAGPLPGRRRERLP